MANYTLEPKNRYHEIYIGWDPMLNTFFLHVIDNSEEEDSPLYDLIWVGTSYNEIHDMDKVLDLVQPYADVPEIIERKMIADSNA